MRQMVFKRFERFWHWSQSLLIMLMMLTGFEIHGSYHLFGYEKALTVHELSALTLVLLWIFAIFWHFTTGEWRQYIPTTEKLMAVVRFYSVDIFQGKPHPYKPTLQRKHNPLQLLSYLGFKLILAPLAWISGVLLLLYPFGVKPFDLGAVSAIHLLVAFLFLIYLIIHVYMTTTGPTVTSHIKAMITGYDEHVSDGDVKK